MKKPIRETKLGQWLKNNVPKVLDTVGDVLPDKGVLGIIKNLIDREELPPEAKSEALAELQKLELEFLSKEIEDRASARTRETDFVKATGHVDWMMILVGFIGLGSFSFVLYVLVYESIAEANRDLFIHAIGMVEGIAISIFSYYFGSSRGSARKTDMLKHS